jgi:hypothetical protein
MSVEVVTRMKNILESAIKVRHVAAAGTGDRAVLAAASNLTWLSNSSMYQDPLFTKPSFTIGYIRRLGPRAF